MFEKKRREGKKALILYITAGFPNLEATRALIPVLEEAGCDLLELGIPFSDPIADGPTIQKASAESLAAGTTLKKTLTLLRELRECGLKMPVILFSALNPIFHYGLKEIVKDAQSAGADGFLCPDLPIEEGAEFKALCDESEMKLIFLIAPTSNRERKHAIAAQCSGFVYYISLKGITGARTELAADIDEQVAEIKGETDLPVCVGFGISKPEQVKALSEQSPDGLIVGSALVKQVEAAFAGGDTLAAVESMREWAKALKAPLL
jgi:tryptophan synthase alpha chain